MVTKILRKSFGLLGIYIVLIISIFIFQFKNESIISEKLGSLQISLMEYLADGENNRLKNKFNAAFNGIVFSASPEKPVTAVIDGEEKPIILTSWKKNPPYSCEFFFTNDISFCFSIGDDKKEENLSISAKLPENTVFVYVPYGLSAGAQIAQKDNSKIQIVNKKKHWELSAYTVDEKIIFSQKAPDAVYSYFDNEKTFSFGLSEAFENSSQAAYSAAVENLKSNLINSFIQDAAETAFPSEQEAVSYIAAMAEKGRYQEALESIPQRYKHSSFRTYLSAPYFNSLVQMYPSLQKQLKLYKEMIESASETNSIDLFTKKDISSFMCINYDYPPVQKVLKNTANSSLEEITVLQAAGIIRVYAELVEKKPELAEILLPAISSCVKKIENSCKLDENNITISEDDTFLSVLDAVTAGEAVLRLGHIIKNQDYIAGGRFIVSSYLKDSSAFDLHTLGDFYPIIVHNNTYYPHYKILYSEKGQVIWAWTCSQEINYETDNLGHAAISISFPALQTHYIIIEGISDFRSIYVYDMAFRTDPRFETYNSSGYVYKGDTKTLLFKSRHRSKIENIRFVYTEDSKN